ncbi:MAG: hypothetical protein SGI84_03345 [Gemmatimonadota bacterium]|nr:hypothetical protein [Gemmatimonadota bacterium]
MIRPLLCTLVLGGTLTSSLVARQAEANAVTPPRIRVTLNDAPHTRITGTPVMVGSDAVRLVPDGRADTVTVMTTAILRLQAVQALRSNAGRGAFIGGLVGAGLGAVGLYALASAFGEGDRDPGSSVVVPIMGAAAGAVPGMLIGGTIGSLSKGERWAVMPLTTLHPVSGKPGVGMQLRIVF